MIQMNTSQLGLKVTTLRPVTSFLCQVCFSLSEQGNLCLNFNFKLSERFKNDQLLLHYDLLKYFNICLGDGTFLIKSLACRELMVSFMKCNSLVHNELDYEVRLEMNNAVFELPLRDEYDSTLFRSNICASLKRQLQTIQPVSYEYMVYPKSHEI